MMSRSRKKDQVKPLPSLIQTVPSEKVPIPSASSLLVATQQPGGPEAARTDTIEQELQALRQGTHPGFLRALDSLDQSQQEQVLYVHRLKEERLRNVDEMFVAEMQAVEDDYQQQAEDIRDKMMEELISKTNEKGKVGDMVTRGKRAKLSTKDERPKKRANLKGIKYTLTSDEINVDLESIRQQLTGLGGSTRSKAKL